MKLNLDLVQGQSDYDFFRSSDDGTSATTTPTNVYLWYVRCILKHN